MLLRRRLQPRHRLRLPSALLLLLALLLPEPLLLLALLLLLLPEPLLLLEPLLLPVRRCRPPQRQRPTALSPLQRRRQPRRLTLAQLHLLHLLHLRRRLHRRSTRRRS